MSGRLRGSHPRHRGSLRWWVAQASMAGLLVGALLLLVALSFGLAGLYLATESRTGPQLYHDRAARVVWLALAAMRALLGVDAFPRQADNPAHEVLATSASLVGVIMPAVVIGIVIVRIFAVRVFEWRDHISACLTAELDGDLFEVSDQEHAFLAVRWYKRLSNVAVTNLRAEAYLRCRSVSRIDGSTLYQYQRLEVLDLNGTSGATCTWPETFSGMPFTLWIPLWAPLDGGKVAEIQGRVLGDGDGSELVVRLSGRAVRAAGQISEERRYHLVDEVQVGRFVPVEPNLAVPTRSWPGWRRFEESIVHAVFVYDVLAHPDELLRLLGHWPGDGDVVRAALRGYVRSWRMCADAATPGADLLSLNLEPGTRPDAATEGLVVRVLAQQLTDLDSRYPTFERIKVTDAVVFDGHHQDEPPDVVWAYVGKPAWTTRADIARAAGTALIDKSYLDQVGRGFAAHNELLAAFQREPLPDGVTVVGTGADPVT